MKKITKVLLAILAMGTLLTGCFGEEQKPVNPDNQGDQNNNSQVQQQPNKEQKEEQKENVVSEALNTEFKSDETAKSMTALNEGTEYKKLTEAEIEQKYNFGKYKNLEKVVYSAETDDSIAEVVIVKLGDAEQSADILLKLLARKNALEAKYADNQEIIDMLNTQDKFIIKQQSNVAVMILGPNAKAIEAEFDKGF